MQKKVLGYLLAILGFAGMILAGYFFVTGTGGRVNLLEVTCYMIAGAACFFTGINYIYESASSFEPHELEAAPELEEVSAIQQQWRTIRVAKNPKAEATAGAAAGTPVS